MARKGMKRNDMEEVPAHEDKKPNWKGTKEELKARKSQDSEKGDNRRWWDMIKK